MKQYFVALVCFFGNACVYCMRLNISTIIVKMVDNGHNSELHTSTETNTSDNLIGKHIALKTYNWNSSTQQLVLSAFYFGYTALAIPGGWLTCSVGGKRSIIAILVWSGILNALTSWAADISVYLLVALRVLDGIGQGMFMSATFVILEKWAHPQERSTLLSISLAGISFGVTIVSSFSNWVSSTSSIGWPMSFYAYSGFSVVIAIVCGVFVYETPDEDPNVSISKTEKLPRHELSENKIKLTSAPWWDIVTSRHVWAVTIAYTTSNCVFIYLTTEIPIYATHILGFSLKEAGHALMLMGTAEFLVLLSTGICADVIIRHEYISVLNTRRLYVFLHLGTCAVCLFSVGYTSGLTAMILIGCTFITIGFYSSGIMANAMEISTSYSGIIVGMMITIGSFSGFLGPMGLGAMIGKRDEQDSWSMMFKIISGISLFGCIFFSIFASAEEEDWAKRENVPEEQRKNYESISSSSSQNR